MIRYTNFINEKKGDYWNELFIKSTHLNDLDILFDFIKYEDMIYKNSLFYMYMDGGKYNYVFMYNKKISKFSKNIYNKIKKSTNYTEMYLNDKLSKHIEKFLNIKLTYGLYINDSSNYKRIEKNFEMLEK